MHTIWSYYACFSNGWHSLNDSFAFLTHDSKIAFVGSSPLLMSSHARHFLCVTISLDAKHMAALMFYSKPKVKRMYRTAAIQALLSVGARSLNVMLSCTTFVHVRSAATMHCAHAGAGPITGIQCVGSRDTSRCAFIHFRGAGGARSCTTHHRLAGASSSWHFGRVLLLRRTATGSQTEKTGHARSTIQATHRNSAVGRSQRTPMLSASAAVGGCRGCCNGANDRSPGNESANIACAAHFKL